MFERLMGFDVRVGEDVVSAHWDDRRRSAYLLDEGVNRPLSVDPLVWPSLFDVGHGIGFSTEERTRLGLAGALGESSALPAWVGPNRPFWEDLGALRDHLRGTGAASPSSVLIAVTICALDGTLPMPGTQWERLGYDVADSSLISGLSNCGYTAQEVAELRPTWSGRLNDHHLFEDVQPAFEFSQLTNRRVPEHAPFYVYGLYVVETNQ